MFLGHVLAPMFEFGSKARIKNSTRVWQEKNQLFALQYPNENPPKRQLVVVVLFYGVLPSLD